MCYTQIVHSSFVFSRLALVWSADLQSKKKFCTFFRSRFILFFLREKNGENEIKQISELKREKKVFPSFSPDLHSFSGVFLALSRKRKVVMRNHGPFHYPPLIVRENEAVSFQKLECFVFILFSQLHNEIYFGL